MNRWLVITIGGLFVLASAGAILVLQVRHNRELWLCHLAADGYAQLAASLRAIHDYRTGQLRIFVLKPDGREEFTGRKDGPYELWTWPTHPTLGRTSTMADEAYVNRYNLRMRSMHERPEDFVDDNKARAEFLARTADGA